MNLRTVTLVLAVAGFTGLVSAQEKKTGFGIILGSPTGLSVKHWTSSDVALQGALGGGMGGLTIVGDYIVHRDAFRNKDFPFYYGPGVFLGQAGFGSPRHLRSTAGLGVRFVFGGDYLFPDHPFSVAIEVGPALLLTPSVAMGVELGVAFRFYP